MPRTLTRYRNTTARTTPDGVAVTLHNTDIFRLSDDGQTVTLDSGGWETVTTKRRMNECADYFGLGFRVHQQDFEWTVTTPDGGVLPFADGMTFAARA